MPDVTVRSIALVRTLLGSERLDLSMPEGATIADVLVRLTELGGPVLATYLAEPKELE